MQAIQGYYDIGIFLPDSEAPPYEGRAIVVFIDDALIQAPPLRKRMPKE